MSIDWMNKTAVVTSVFGAHDYHGKQVFITEADYYYVTDGLSDPYNNSSLGYGWNIIHLDFEDKTLDNRRKSKFAKIAPHRFDFLSKYKYVIWIDGDMQIVDSNFIPSILSFMKNGLVVSPHFDNRDCAYGEATIRPPKYQNEPLDEQVAFYRQEGFPENMGLYECGVMARDMENEEVRKLSELWLEQNLTWSYQDQVSLPYCLWKTGFKPDVLPETFRNFNWVVINAHRNEN